MTLHWLEILPIAAYLVAILFLGFYRRDRSASEEDFIVGGRRLTLPAFIATLVTTWYGGILGVGEFTYLYGISNWVVFGLPYYVFAILFA
ncbi:MAG: sodium:solute symporter family protein, partial [Calditrichaeota bacterium]|nr:sodium:solute symporter family protein [Calditrichota bacterium]